MADKVNLVYLSIWMATIALGMFNFGYGVGMFNNFTEIVFLQYENKKANVISNMSTFDSLVTTAFPVGAAFGSFTGGMIAALGRRNGLLITNLIVCVGTGITMIFSFYALIIGRIIFGFGCGVYTVIVPLFISETSPPSVAGVMGAISQFNVTGGIMIAYLLGYIAPLRYTKNGGVETNEDVFTTNAWRIVFIFPAGVAIIQSLLVLLVFRYDTPKYYRQKGQDELEQKVYQAIYKSRDSEINKSVNESPQIREQTVPVTAL
jgi:MFS family permease